MSMNRRRTAEGIRDMRFEELYEFSTHIERCIEATEDEEKITATNISFWLIGWSEVTMNEYKKEED